MEHDWEVIGPRYPKSQRVFWCSDCGCTKEPNMPTEPRFYYRRPGLEGVEEEPPCTTARQELQEVLEAHSMKKPLPEDVQVEHQTAMTFRVPRSVLTKLRCQEDPTHPNRILASFTLHAWCHPEVVGLEKLQSVLSGGIAAVFDMELRLAE